MGKPPTTTKKKNGAVLADFELPAKIPGEEEEEKAGYFC